MSKQQIKLVCAHGIADGETTFVDRFQLTTALGADRWVSKVSGYRPTQLHGDEPLTFPLPQEPPGDSPIRNRYEAECKRCRRSVVLRDDKLQELLTRASMSNLDTLKLDGFR